MSNNVNEFLKQVEEEQTLQSQQRELLIANLYKARGRLIHLVDKTARTLQQRKEELQTLNKDICLVQGHSYTDWQMHDGPIDRSWYYTKECTVCGKKVRTEDEPKEFREQCRARQLKK